MLLMLLCTHGGSDQVIMKACFKNSMYMMNGFSHGLLWLLWGCKDLHDWKDLDTSKVDSIIDSIQWQTRKKWPSIINSE